ncbi:MAG: CopG family transcriptional regulator [Gammaproteobacteria bacterium]
MSERIKHTDEPLGDLRVVPDLPSPDELGFKDDTVKVTISLSRASVEFFKQEAKKHRTQYQKMIRRLLDTYTEVYQQPLTRRSTPDFGSCCGHDCYLVGRINALGVLAKTPMYA